MMFTLRKITILIVGMVFTAGLAVSFAVPIFAGENHNSSRSNTSTGIINRDVGNVLLRYSIGGAEINQVTDALARPEGIDTVVLKAMLVKFGVSDAGITELFAELERLGTGDTPQSAPATPATGTIIIKDPNGGTVVSSPDAGGASRSTAVNSGLELVRDEIVVPDTGDTVPSMVERIKSIFPSKRTEAAPDAADTAQQSKSYRRVLLQQGNRTVSTPDAGDTAQGVEEIEIAVEQIKRGAISTTDTNSVRGGFKEISGIESETGLVDNIRENDNATARSRVRYSNITLKRGEFHDAAMNVIQNIRTAAPEERENLKEELKASRETFKAEIVSMNLSISENAKELRDNFRENVKTTIGHVDHGKTAHIAVAHGKGLKMLNRFRSAMVRFDHILGRLESRVLKLEAQGYPTDSFFDVFTLIEEAENMQLVADAKMEELKAKYESLLLGENTGGIAEEARAIATELKTETENLHAKLRQIADDIKQATGDYNSSISNSSSERIALTQNTIANIQERLKSCDNTDVCDVVDRHAKQRAELTITIKKALENGNREEATQLLRKVRGIVVGDIELLEGVENIGSITGVLELERSLLNYVDSTLVLIK